MLAVRLLRLDLHRRYRVFFAYLIFWTVRSAVLLPVNVKSGAYQIIWIVTEPLLWVFYILLVLELYSLILESHKGLYTVGRWVMYFGFGIAVVGSVLSLIPPPHDPVKQSTLLAYVLLIERGVDVSVVLFLLVMLLFLLWYPVPLSRNVIVHSVVYSVFFISNSLGFLLASTLGYHLLRPVNLGTMAVSTICVFIWLKYLSRAGEERLTTLRAAWRPGQERQLVEQLNSINATLLRAVRK